MKAASWARLVHKFQRLETSQPGPCAHSAGSPQSSSLPGFGKLGLGAGSQQPSSSGRRLPASQAPGPGKPGAGSRQSSSSWAPGPGNHSFLRPPAPCKLGAGSRSSSATGPGKQAPGPSNQVLLGCRVPAIKFFQGAGPRLLRVRQRRNLTRIGF